MESVIYDIKGKEAGKIDLPKSVFGLSWNADLVHQAVTAIMANKRNNVAHTKMRGEVSGTGKKPWRQKGTGRARHGSRRSPIWRHGGVAHGPRNDRDYTQKLSRSMSAKALFTVLSKKYKDGEILFVDAVSLENAKAKEAKAVIQGLGSIKGFEKLSGRRKNAALIALGKNDVSVKRGFRNFGNVFVNEARNLNPVDVLNYKYLVIASPEESLKQIASRMA